MTFEEFINEKYAEPWFNEPHKFTHVKGIELARQAWATALADTTPAAEKPERGKDAAEQRVIGAAKACADYWRGTKPGYTEDILLAVVQAVEALEAAEAERGK